jgi:hypothetical protein
MKQNHRRVYVGADFERDPALLAQLYPQFKVAGEQPQQQMVGGWGDPQIVGAPGYSGDPQIVGAEVQVKSAENPDFYDEWLPLTGDAGITIAAGATADFELKPNKLFRPGPLVIPAATAVNLIMTNFAIGGNPVFARSGAIPCAAFSELATHKTLNSRTANNSAPMTFTLKNIHASVAQVVYGLWLGKTVSAG